MAGRVHSARPLLLALACLVQIWRAYGEDYDFNLEDALDFTTRKPTPKPSKPAKKPSGDTGDLDLSDFFDTPSKTVTKPPPKKKDDHLWDLLHTTTTKRPKATRAPPKKPGKDPLDLDLADALDDRNDGVKPKPDIGGAFSDQDLIDIQDDGYQPDKNKGGGRGGGGSGNSEDNSGSIAETGTIAGIASALAMALIGAVSSYISYQQKKFCFSIQQGLNAEYVKGENMEGVVSEEPQVKYTALDSQSAEPPKLDAAVV
ncbi:CD99 antigen-like protein 2 isoform X2 [Ambystoma mexicanum]|uniref:CD99 antigen-like protein 2 isoform X2 n=1 Tax=Ambystoma mexicanum TaxID=8296 RepID=UPI0037E7D3B5